MPLKQFSQGVEKRTEYFLRNYVLYVSKHPDSEAVIETTPKGIRAVSFHTNLDDAFSAAEKCTHPSSVHKIYRSSPLPQKFIDSLLISLDDKHPQNKNATERVWEYFRH